jgi:adenylylsulfate kinase
VLITMAGLPGSGKSTLAALLAGPLGGVVLDKDRVRASLFPPPVLNYSAVQDDITMAAIFRAAAAILEANPSQAVVLDGRTFLRAGQADALAELGSSVGQTPRVILCVCDDEVARARLERDLAEGQHPARNRTYDLYLSLKARAMPLALPHLTVDTGRLSAEECVRRCLEYLAAVG